jgi:hypothetical protein
MNHFHVSVRCRRSACAISNLLVTLSAYAEDSVAAFDVMQAVARRWKSPWMVTVVGIERAM